MRLQDELDALVPLGKARREIIPRNSSGLPISPATAWRWIRKGLKKPSGKPIRLRIVMVGNRPYVSRAAIEEFFARLTEAREKSQAPSEETTYPAWKEERLRAAGLL